MKYQTLSAIPTVMAIIALAAPVLFGIFAVMQLCHVIDWSWWLVTAPLWVGALLIVSIFIAVLSILSTAGLILRHKSEKGPRR